MRDRLSNKSDTFAIINNSVLFFSADMLSGSFSTTLICRTCSSPSNICGHAAQSAQANPMFSADAPAHMPQPVLQDATAHIVNSQSTGEQPVQPQDAAVPPTPAAQGQPNSRKRAQPDADSGQPRQKQARQGAQKTTSSRNTRQKKTLATAATVGTAIQVGVYRRAYMAVVLVRVGRSIFAFSR